MRVAALWLTLCCALPALCATDQVPLRNHHPLVLPGDAPSYRTELLELHKSLVSIRSTSGLENAVGDWLSNYLFEKGWRSTIQFVPPLHNTPQGSQRMNILAWPDSNSDQDPDPKVLLTSHIDTVPPHIPYRIEEGQVTKGTRISGRGSVDAKASVASMIVALEELLKADKVAGDDVMLLFVVGEEVSGDGMLSFNDSLNSLDSRPNFDAVIFGEPTEGKLACGHKGAVFCHIEAHGVGGHSGYPWLGKSANELIIRAMARIMDADLGSSDRFGNTTINVGLMEGGVAANVIPEHASASIMGRVALGPEATGGRIVQDRIIEILREVDEEAFSFDCLQGYGFIETDCDVEGRCSLRRWEFHHADSYSRFRVYGGQLRHGCP